MITLGKGEHMGKIFIISDMHFNHANIIGYCNRPFRDVNHMNTVLISNYNSTVSEQDDVWNLGDIGFDRGTSLLRIFKSLNGSLRLVEGNHDRFGSIEYMDMGFKSVCNKSFLTAYKGLKILLSHKPAITNKKFGELKGDPNPKSYLFINDIQYADMDLNIHGHIHNNQKEVLNTGKHFNASVEMIDYRPIELDKILEVMNF